MRKERFWLFPVEQAKMALSARGVVGHGAQALTETYAAGTERVAGAFDWAFPFVSRQRDHEESARPIAVRYLPSIRPPLYVAFGAVQSLDREANTAAICEKVIASKLQSVLKIKTPWLGQK